MFIFINDNSEEIYEKNNHLLCKYPKETIQACIFINEALKYLERYATSKDCYKLCNRYYAYNIYFYKKKHRGHTNVEKIQYIIINQNEVSINEHH